MTTRQLYYLVTIADQGSLSGASRVLGISQPALSKFLSEYESSLGFLLFLRYHRQLTPTAVGRYVIDAAQKILDEQTRMLQSMRAVTDSDHTLIRLATAPNRGAIIYSQVYNPFSRRYPDITLSLTELYASEQPGAIQHGQIDLAIGSGKTSDKTTDLPFAREELLISLPVSHPLSGQESIRLSDLRDTPFVLQGHRHSIRILAEELFEQAGFSPVVTFESNDVMLVDSMLHQAVGVGLVSQAHVFPCEELVYRPLTPPVYQTLHIRYPAEHTLTEPERYLAGLLMRERLADKRYQPIPSPEAEEMIRLTEHPLTKEPTGSYEIPGESPAAALSETYPHKSRQTYHSAPQISLNPQLLRYIIAIVDEKSLSKAAERFYLTQPALSRCLRNAEDMLCTRLFTRIHNRLQPTNAGKIFVNFARNMLLIDSEMEEHILASRQGHGGHLHLQCDSSVAPMIRNQICNSFSLLCPNVSLSVSENSRDKIEESLLNASADLGIYFSSQEVHPILESRILARTNLVYCCGNTRENPLRIMTALPNTAFYQEQMRLFDEQSEGSRSIVCESELSILRFLAAVGAADTILPADLVPEEAKERCMDFSQPQNYYLLMVSHPGRTLPPSVRDLTHLLYDTFENWFFHCTAR